MKDTLRQTANLVTVLIALTVNILASALPLNGQNTGEISDRFAVYFVPAGYVFAIWFFIFVGWIAFAIYQFQPSQKESPRLRRLGYLFAISNLFNAAWLFAWHYNFFGLSVLIMLTLLGLSDRQLSAPECEPRLRQRRGMVVGGSAFQRLSRLDHGRNSCKHHLVVVFSRVERLWDFRPSLGGHHDRRGIRGRHFDGGHATGRGVSVRAGLVLYRYLRSSRHPLPTSSLPHGLEQVSCWFWQFTV